MKIMIASFALLLAAFMPKTLWAADGAGVKQFMVDKITVYPLLDANGTMDASIFRGPLSEEEKLAYMPGGKAPSSVNVFLLKMPGANVLIDVGWGLSGPGGEAVTKNMKLAGLTPDDIDIVLLTHAHPDHIGGLLDGRAAFFKKAKLMMSAPEYRAMGGLLKIAPGGAEDGAAVQPSESQAPPRDDQSGQVLQAYQGRTESFAYGDEVLPGLTALDASGHTPGHTVFALKSGDREMLFVGDIVHAAALQFPEPEECATYDRDQVKAVESRREILTLAAEKNIVIAGAHIPFPGTGFVKADGKRGFTFTPVAAGSGS